MLHRFVLHNDDLRGASEPLMSAGQVGALMGWGVFTTFRITKGTLFAFERHWARMKRDADLLRVPFPANPEWLHVRLLRLIHANSCPEGTMRVCIVKNTGTVFVGPGIQRDFDLDRHDDRPGELGRIREAGCCSERPVRRIPLLTDEGAFLGIQPELVSGSARSGFR